MFTVIAYIKHVPGHKNSEGEVAEWCVISHGTDKVISSHKTEEEAKSHLKDMKVHAVLTFPYEEGKAYEYNELPESAQLEVDAQFDEYTAYNGYPDDGGNYLWVFKYLQPSELEDYLLSHFGDHYGIDAQLEDEGMEGLIEDIRINGVQEPAVGQEGNHRALACWYLNIPLPYLEPHRKEGLEEDEDVVEASLVRKACNVCVAYELLEGSHKRWGYEFKAEGKAEFAPAKLWIRKIGEEEWGNPIHTTDLAGTVSSYGLDMQDEYAGDGYNQMLEDYERSRDSDIYKASLKTSAIQEVEAAKNEPPYIPEGVDPPEDKDEDEDVVEVSLKTLANKRLHSGVGEASLREILGYRNDIKTTTVFENTEKDEVIIEGDWKAILEVMDDMVNYSGIGCAYYDEFVDMYVEAEQALSKFIDKVNAKGDFEIINEGEGTDQYKLRIIDLRQKYTAGRRNPKGIMTKRKRRTLKRPRRGKSPSLMGKRLKKKRRKRSDVIEVPLKEDK